MSQVPIAASRRQSRAIGNLARFSQPALPAVPAVPALLL